MSVNLHARLLLAALLPMVLLMLMSSVVLHYVFAAALQRGFDQRLEDALAALIASAQVDASGVKLRRTLSESAFAQVRSGWYWQISDMHSVLKRSRSLWDSELGIGLVSIDAPVRYLNLRGPADEELRVALRSVQWPAAHLVFAVAGPRRQIDVEIADFRRLLIAGVSGLLLCAALALWIQVRLGLRPLRRLGVELAAIEMNALDRLSRPAVTELAMLADKVNSVLDQNQRMAQRGRKLAGDLAHALKTPLAVLNSELKAATPGVKSSLQRLDAIIQRHLAQASAQARREHACTELSPLLQSLSTLFQKLHGDRALQFRIEVPNGLQLRCEAEDLTEILGNLIDNACRAARTQVRIRAVTKFARVHVFIDDDGDGLGPSALAQLGERGKRFDEQQGSGLGVSIASDIAESYEGELQFTRSELGGLSAQLSLPLVGR